MVDAALPRVTNEANGASGQGSVVTFPSVAPWPDPVDGVALLDGLANTFLRFVALPEHVAPVAALWVVLTHGHDAFSISPLLAVTSPEKRCGKTTVLELLGALVARPLAASNISTAAVFRIVEMHSPTLLVDEADTFVRGNNELRGVINGGHKRSSAFVVRSVGEDHDPKQFFTWCPKAIACIGKLPDTLEDRAIVVRMRRRRPDERVERLRLDRTAELAPLRSQAARWAKDWMEELEAADPDVPAGLHDRAADNWRPLLAIADAAGGDWPDVARQAAISLSGSGDDEQAPGVLALADLAEMFRDREVDRLQSDEIVQHFVKLEHRPWPEYKNDRPLTLRQLARLLSRFGIRPKTIRFADGIRRGYELDDCRDAFARYLSVDPQQPQQGNNDATFGAPLIRNDGDHVADVERTEIARQTELVSDVADESVQSDAAIVEFELRLERAAIIGEPLQ